MPADPLVDRIAKRLARGFFGSVARHAVRAHPWVYGGTASDVIVGDGVVLNDALLNCSSGTIRIDRDAFLGHGVSLLTGTHDHRRLGPDRQRAVPPTGRDIVVGEGAWLASNVTVVGPCSIGPHAVVAAGAVVTRDVPAYAIVGGVPARVLGHVPAA